MPDRKVGFGAVGITGNKPGNLDYIPTRLINTQDICVVLENSKLYFYRLKLTNEEENVPYIVKCKNYLNDEFPTRASLKRGYLISQEVYTTNIIQYLSKYIQTSQFQSFTGEDLILKTGLEEDITIKSNGEVIFPSSVGGQDPVENNDFVTKNYIKRNKLIDGVKMVATSDSGTADGEWYYTDLIFE